MRVPARATAGTWIAALVSCGGAAGDPDAAAVIDAGLDAAPPAPGCLVWPRDRQWGTAGDDTAGVVIGRDGDLALFGYEGGAAGATIAPGGDATGYVERFAPDGGRRWRYQLATPGPDAVDAVELAADGAIVAGRLLGGGASPQFELQVAALDAAGAERWRRGAGTAPPERATAIASSGDLHVVGGYQDIYIPTNYVEAWEDPFVLAWRGDDVASAVFWPLGTERADLGGGVLVAGDGAALLAVRVDTGADRGGHVARFDLATGEHELVAINPGSLEAVVGLRRLPDGDVLVAGSTVRQLGPVAHGAQDGFVARYDPALTSRRWVAQIGTVESDVVTAMAAADDGRVWLVGETLGAFDAAAPNQGGVDVFVVALAPDGSERWRWQRGTAEYDAATHIAVDACANVIVAGATPGALAGPALGGDDAFAMRAGPP